MTFIQLSPEAGDMLTLVMLLLWPHIPLHCIIFKVLSHVSSHLVVAKREFPMVQGAALPFHFLKFNGCGTWEARSPT